MSTSLVIHRVDMEKIYSEMHFNYIKNNIKKYGVYNLWKHEFKRDLFDTLMINEGDKVNLI